MQEIKFVTIVGDPPYGGSVPPTYEGVELIVSDISPSGVKFKISNETGIQFTFGYFFRLFERQDNTWVEIEHSLERAFDSLGIFIHPQSETNTQEQFFLYDPGWIEKPEKTTLDSGEYMFVVPYSQGGANEDFLDHYSARHVFTIE
ncbi:MAG: hypothetical protein FWG45_03885 [Oscillospiraceae bacterium]|nr:hypothetical protein [Oscillospiraceae bacterium]